MTFSLSEALKILFNYNEKISDIMLNSSNKKSTLQVRIEGTLEPLVNEYLEQNSEYDNIITTLKNVLETKCDKNDLFNGYQGIYNIIIDDIRLLIQSLPVPLSGELGYSAVFRVIRDDSHKICSLSHE